MKEQTFLPYLAQIPGEQDPAIVWAPDEDAAIAEIHQRFSIPDGTDLNVRRPAAVVVPDRMKEMPLSELWEGEFVQTGSADYPTMILTPCLERARTAVIYLRVSTKKQATKYGLLRQEKYCRLLAQVAGLTVVETYREVAGGASLCSRPKLLAALDDLKVGRTDVLIVESMDRLTRSSHDAPEIFRQVPDGENRIVFAMQQLPGSAEFQLKFSIFLAASQFRHSLLVNWGLSGTNPYLGNVNAAMQPFLNATGEPTR